jgi:hypothetical protein
MPQGGARPNTGGKREGAGRPPGPISETTMLTRRAAAEIIQQGRPPLNVLVDTMNWWDRELQLLEDKIRATSLPPGHSFLEISRKNPIVEAFFVALDKRLESAEKAANFVHPRYRAIAVMTPGEGTAPAAASKTLASADDESSAERASRAQATYLQLIKGGRDG